MPLWGVSLLLVVYWGIRLHQLTILPLFLDETISISWSADVWQGGALHFGSHGKLLLPWWGALFQPQLHEAAFVMRVASLLLVLMGAAGIVALGKRLANIQVGLMALFVMTVAPMFVFFDRMALTDTVLHAMTTLFVWALMRLWQRSTYRRRDAILAGSLFILAFLAKSSALLLLLLPLVAVVILPRGWSRLQAFQSVGAVYLSMGLMWLPLQIVMLWREINYLGLAQQFSTGQNPLSGLDKLVHNFNFMIQGPATYFGSAFLVLTVIGFIAALRYIPRKSLVLLAAISGFCFGIIFFGDVGLSIRYWLAVMPLVVVLMVAGLYWLVDDIGQRIQRLAIIRPAAVMVSIFAIWGVAFGLPFIVTAYNSPESLTLVDKDRGEYIMSDAAGTRLPEMADLIHELTKQIPTQAMVIGAFVQCETLALYASESEEVVIDCPNVLAGGRRGEWLHQYIREKADNFQTLYVIFETPGYASTDDIPTLTLEPLLELNRPEMKVF